MAMGPERWRGEEPGWWGGSLWTATFSLKHESRASIEAKRGRTAVWVKRQNGLQYSFHEACRAAGRGLAKTEQSAWFITLSSSGTERAEGRKQGCQWQGRDSAGSGQWNAVRVFATWGCWGVTWSQTGLTTCQNKGRGMGAHDGASLVAQTVKNRLQCRRPGFDHEAEENLWRTQGWRREVWWSSAHKRQFHSVLSVTLLNEEQKDKHHVRGSVLSSATEKQERACHSCQKEWVQLQRNNFTGGKWIFLQDERAPIASCQKVQLCSFFLRWGARSSWEELPAKMRFPAGAWSQEPAPYQSTWSRPGSCPADPVTETPREEPPWVPASTWATTSQGQGGMKRRKCRLLARWKGNLGNTLVRGHQSVHILSDIV